LQLTLRGNKEAQYIADWAEGGGERASVCIIKQPVSGKRVGFSGKRTGKRIGKRNAFPGKRNKVAGKRIGKIVVKILRGCAR